MSPGRDTLELLYRRYAPMVYRRARRLLASDADAHEVVQDVFLSLFERPAQYSAKSALATYLYSATTHACLNRINRQRNRARLLRERVSQPTEQSDGQEHHCLLHQLLAQMPEALARVVIYAYVDDLTHEEIALLLGCSRRQVGKLLERAATWIRGEEERVC